MTPLGPRAALISPSLSTPAVALGGPQSAHLGKWGGARRLPPGLSWVRLAGDRGRGRAPRCPRKASLSHLTLPPRLPWLLLGPLPLCSIFLPPISSPTSLPRHRRVSGGRHRVRAQPDMLQHPRQLPVCEHAVSCHLPAGLQPWVRAELARGRMGRIPCQDLGSRHSGSCIARRRKEGLQEGPVLGRDPLRVIGSTLPGLLGGAPELTGQCALKHFPAATWGESSPGQYHSLHSDAWAMRGAQGAGRRQSRERTGGRGAGRWTHRDTWEHMHTFRKLWTQEHTCRCINPTQNPTQNPRAQTRAATQTQNTFLSLWLQTLLNVHRRGDGPWLAPTGCSC